MFFRLLIGLLFICSTVFGQAEDRFNIQIAVLDSQTNQPLDLVTIHCMPGNKWVKTDQYGKAFFNNLKKGTYTFTFSHVGCPDLVKTLSIDRPIVLNVAMLHQAVQLFEVQIMPHLSKSFAINQLDQNKVKENIGLSFSEILAKIPGVNLLQSSPGIQKPIINGMTDSRIVYVNRGVRLESQQWGQDHAPEIDPSQAGRIKLVVPARSFRMGADGLAAMVEVLPKAFPEAGKHQVEVGSVLMVNNRLWGGNLSLAGFEPRLWKLQWRISVSGRQAGNTRTPAYWLYNTGFTDRNLGLELALPFKKGKIETDFTWFQATSGIFLGSQIGNVTDLIQAIQLPKPLFNVNEFSYQIDRPRQEVNHWTTRVRFLSGEEQSRHWQIQIAAQQNHRREFDLARISESPELDLTLSSIQLYGEWHSGKSFSTGIAGNLKENVWSGSRYFIPNYRLINPAWYFNWKHQLKKHILYSGIRFDYNHLETYRNQNGNFFSDERNWASAGASALLEINAGNQNQQQLELSILWRPPQVNELYVNGLHHGTSSFERGDSRLKQEGGIKLSWLANVHFWRNRAGFQQQLFSQYMPGFIYAKPDGQPILTIRGAFPSFTFTQTNAWLNGGNWLFFVEPVRNLRFEAKFQSVLAFDWTNQTWIAPMPADRADLSLRKEWPNRTFNRQFYLAIGCAQLFKQQRLPTLNNDFLPPPVGIMLMRMEAGGKIKLKSNELMFSLTASNLFNQIYREYLNRLRYFSDEAGLNFIARLQYQFNY